MFKTILILTPMAIAFGLGLDSLLPVLPQIQTYFGASVGTIHLCAGIYVGFFAVTQLFIGTLSDIFGRKKVCLLSFSAYIISGLGCTLSESIETLIIFRALGGIGACGALVTALAHITDTYKGVQASKAYGYITGMMALAPVIGPYLGSFLNLFFGWRGCFIGIAAFGFFGLITSLLFFKNRNIAERENFSFGIIKNALENRQFILCSLISLISCAILFSCYSLSSIVFITHFSLSQNSFNLFFALNSLLHLIFAFLSGFLLEKYGLKKTLGLGNIIIIFGGGILLCSFYTQIVELFGAGISLSSIGIAIVLSGGTGGALSLYATYTGTISALFCFIKYLGASLIGTTIARLPFELSFSLAMSTIALSTIALLTTCWLNNKKSSE